MRTEISTVVGSGLDRWRMVPNAHVNFLTDPGQPDLRVPRVLVESETGLTPGSPLVVCIGGAHLEEPSGYHVLSSPEHTLPIIHPYLRRYSFLYYPQINFYGPHFIDADGIMRPKFTDMETEEAEKLTRHNENGINYNDGWGKTFAPDKKTREGALVEKDMNELMAACEIVLGIANHEDSLVPHRGYIWVNGQQLVARRSDIQRTLDQGWHGGLVNAADTHTIPELSQTIIEWDRFVAVESRDHGSWETYLNDAGVPTVVSEAPFRDPLAARLNFHQRVLSGTLEALLR